MITQLKIFISHSEREPYQVSTTGSPISYCEKVKAYISINLLLKISTKSIRLFSGCGSCKANFFKANDSWDIVSFLSLVNIALSSIDLGKYLQCMYFKRKKIYLWKICFSFSYMSIPRKGLDALLWNFQPILQYLMIISF